MEHSKESAVPTRILGRTGERVSLIGLGGAHLRPTDLPAPESIRIIRTAIDNGITFLDNCWDYNEGKSEITGESTPQRVPRSGVPDDEDRRPRPDLRRTPDRRIAREARTDHIDFLQFHEIIRADDPVPYLCRGPVPGSGDRRTTRGRDPLYRLYRAQTPGVPHTDA